MSQVLVNLQINEEDKSRMEQALLFIDPFYSESNISYLLKVTSEIDLGSATLAEHSITEK